jgi:hypothetical protein
MHILEQLNFGRAKLDFRDWILTVDNRARGEVRASWLDDSAVSLGCIQSVPR